MQVAAANSATAGMEAATAKKMLAEFRAAITAQVATLEQRLGVDALELTKVIIISAILVFACAPKPEHSGFDKHQVLRKAGVDKYQVLHYSDFVN